MYLQWNGRMWVVQKAPHVKLSLNMVLDWECLLLHKSYIGSWRTIACSLCSLLVRCKAKYSDLAHCIIFLQWKFGNKSIIISSATFLLLLSVTLNDNISIILEIVCLWLQTTYREKNMTSNFLSNNSTS